jgi:hypothetical protein
MSSIKIFDFILNTRSTISGWLDAMRLGGRVANISGHATFEVKVMKRSSQPNFQQIPMQSEYF